MKTKLKSGLFSCPPNRLLTHNILMKASRLLITRILVFFIDRIMNDPSEKNKADNNMKPMSRDIIQYYFHDIELNIWQINQNKSGLANY
ncbi:hypothetical protein [Dysgonomonas termitidis]